MKLLLLLVLLVSSACFAMHKPAATNQNEDDGYDTDPVNLEYYINHPTDPALLQQLLEMAGSKKTDTPPVVQNTPKPGR